jgi:predicted N-formylglutamate amidohydrolase
LSSRSLSPHQLVVSCEHASNRLPARYGTLGLPRRRLSSHIAWDAGARRVARYCASRLGCAFHAGRYSRLLIDLNRSLHHPKLIPQESFGVRVPYNVGISEDERWARIRRYYEPYRSRIFRDIEHVIGRYGTCVHLSVHSFTPRLARQLRRADIGILYDPRRPLESQLARWLTADLKERGYHTRRNYPYRGTSDGFTTYCRGVFPASAYLGIEIEINQARLERSSRLARITSAVADCVNTALLAGPWPALARRFRAPG